MATMSLVTPGGKRVSYRNDKASLPMRVTSPLGSSRPPRMGQVPKGVRGQRSRRVRS